MPQRLRFGHPTDFGCTLQQSRYLPWCARPDFTLVVAPELLRLFWGFGVALASATPHDDTLPCIGVPAPPGVGLPRFWEDPGAGSDVARLPRPRVGLCWRGSGVGNQGFLPDGTDPRDVPAALLRPLVEHLAGITWIGLQLADHAHELLIRDLHSFGVRDFADTAGVLRQLDLVITVDTAVAHLSGNLGRPTWVLLNAGDTRGVWPGLVAGPAPEYPSVRLWPQAVRGEWAPVLAALEAALDADPEELGREREREERSGADAAEVERRLRLHRMCRQGRAISAGPWEP